MLKLGVKGCNDALKSKQLNSYTASRLRLTIPRVSSSESGIRKRGTFFYLFKMEMEIVKIFSAVYRKLI